MTVTQEAILTLIVFGGWFLILALYYIKDE